MIASIPVFYTSRMVANSQSLSPSSQKPAYVVDAWKNMGIPLEIVNVDPISEDDLCLAHDLYFVQDILKGRRENGFGNSLPKIARSLLFTNASMRDAAKRAIDNRTVAVSPTSGFHHAQYSKAAAYCTFNGLMVTSCWLLKNNHAKKIGIIDCDHHYGDGTDDIINKLRLSGQIMHFTAGAEFFMPDHAMAFFKRLSSVMESMRDCDLVLYQAGADPHIDDPLGGFLTTPELYRRDLLVFQLCKEYKVPVAWNLAGGYQRLEDGSPNWDALTEIHSNTMKACWEVFGNRKH